MNTLSYGIEEAELGVRAYNILKRHNVNTLADLLEVTANDLNEWARIPGHAMGLPAAMQIAEAQRWVRQLA